MVAKISLRDYLGGIEELIDNGRTEDALAHCRHILTLFPKNVATYRLMAKAYLESHQHAEASDIFQRVLSSIPDDFVSHIGMSMIHEEASDLDASIWNMERAFEAQPSNRAVQDELRRLYNKREGYIPPKVRLTRGALARMYAHGDLYNQAIGELRSALAEDPLRPDLQVLLAEMYFKTKREVDAAEVCTALLEKLPYCLYANRLQADILQKSERKAEAKPYVDRVEELDPYAAQVDTLTPVDSAPANIVMLEQLVIETPAAKVQPVPKAWTGSLVLEERKFEKEELPDWLSVERGNIERPEEEKGEPIGIDSAPMEESEPIPSFEAGPSEEKPPIDPEVKEVPDWLSELRPTTSGLVSEDEGPPVNEPESQGTQNWLEELRPTRSLGPDGEEGAGEPESTPAPMEQILEDEQELAAEKPPPFTPEESESEAFPQESAEMEKSSQEEPGLSWLEAMPATPTASEEPESFEEEDIEAERISASAMEEFPTESEAASRDSAKVEKSPQEDASLGWLENLAAQQGAPEEELLTAPEDRETAKLDWPSDEPEEKRDSLAWLDELTATSEQPSAESEEALFDEPEKPSIQEPSGTENGNDINVTTPLWLKELTSEMGGTAALGGEGEESVAPRSMEEAPDWLSDLGARAEETTEDEVEETIRAETEPAKTAEELSKLDWLEELGPPKIMPEKGEWVSETQPPGDQPISEAVAVPAVKLKRAAALKAEKEAPNRLELARQSLNSGKLGEAADHFGYLLRRRWLIKDIIADLDAAVHRHPGDATLWQTLGDAYMRNNQLRQALDCYNRAKDLL